jgi:tetratricopeptide (TPR) repeat protein
MQDGAEGWQHDTERKSTGISLSPDGGYMAVGARDGTISLFGIVAGDEAAGQSANLPDTVVAHARNLMEANQPVEACAVLKAAMAANAVDLTLYDEYVRLKDAWHDSAIERGKQAMAHGDARVAIGAFAAMLDEDPLCTQAAVLLTDARAMRATQLIETAQRQESADDVGGAEASLREAAAVAPTGVIEPRRALAAFLERRAGIYEALAETMIREENTHAALDALTQAQCTCPRPERAARIQRLQTDVEFEAGMQAYNAKQYVQAVFQFKKVLRLDKNHADAQRHLEFARRFSQESSTDSLQDRFSRLE